MSKPTFNFKVNTQADALKESGAGGQFISNSGIYPVTINFLSINQSSKGSYNYALNIDYNGNSQTIYGPTIQNNDGSENVIGSRSLNKVCVIAGLDSGAALNLEEEEHTVGKDNEVKTFVVATDLSGLECKLQLKRVYDKYKGEIKPKLNIESFFRMSDGASADEIVAEANGKDVTFGAQLAKIEENEATTQPRYGKDEDKNQVTEEEVAAFLEAKKSGNSTTTSAPTETKQVKKNLFA